MEGFIVIALFVATAISVSKLRAYFGLSPLAWKSGVWPQGWRFNEANVLEAYVCISAVMIRKERRDIKDKQRFLISYCKQHFRKSYYNISGQYARALRHPINAKGVAKWFYRKGELKDHVQLLYFLAGLAHVDGGFGARELAFLESMRSLLKVDKNELERILNIYYVQEQERKRQAKASMPVSKSKKELCMEIMGMDELTEASLKKAYRALAKIHHPDLFANAGDGQQAMAEEKFSRINLAKDYLEKYV